MLLVLSTSLMVRVYVIVVIGQGGSPGGASPE